MADTEPVFSVDEPWDSRDYLLEDCWNCGGEGYVADCFDGFCINSEDGCELCMARCDYCNPPPLPEPPRNSDGRHD